MRIEDLNVGDRVRMMSGRDAIVLGLCPDKISAFQDRVEVRYDDGSTIWSYTYRVVSVLTPMVVEKAPEKKEPIRVRDRVRHSRKVSPDFRRLGGTVMSVDATGRSVVVLWDGLGNYREELVSQLEVVHRAEKAEPTPMEQVRQLLDTEGEVVTAEINKLQERLQAISAAKAALPC